MPLNKIPNTLLGDFGNHFSVFVFFPGAHQSDRLWRSQSGRTLESERRLLYDYAVMPAVRSLLPTQVAHWPASYDSEWGHSKRYAGRRAHRTVDVPASRVAEFSRKVLENLEQVGEDEVWARGAFFLIQGQNAKLQTQHRVGDAEAAEEAWASLTADMDYGAHEYETHFRVDAALELSLPGHVLHWHRPSVHLVYAAACGVSTAEAERVVAGSRFQVNRVAHLTDLVGFRCFTPQRVVNDHPDAPIFVHAYGTDKTSTYKFRLLLASLPLKVIAGRNKAGNPMDDYFNDLMCVFDHCRITEQPGGARVEARLGYAQAKRWMEGGLSAEVIRSSVVDVSDGILW